MAFCFDDTIAAIASAPGSAVRGLIRISGPDVREVYGKLLGDDPFPADLRSAQAISVVVPIDAGRLSLHGQLLFWPNRRSFTGEPLAEFHLIGSPPLLEEVLERIYLCGARPAERGEFTLRAFLANRLDLVQAEAVLGVIDAADPRELETALGQLGGGISALIGAAREQLLLHLADLEAGLDFVEEDIDFVSRPDLVRRLDEAGVWIQQLIDQVHARMQSTGRWRVVLAGLPNAGKSTLFNRLVGDDAALVSPVPGTTRDYLTASVLLDGAACDLVDTAGWETARDGIEEAAALLREDQFHRAHLIVWCTPADLPPELQALNETLRQQCSQDSLQVLHVITKSDTQVASLNSGDQREGVCAVSAEQGTGLLDLRREIARQLSSSVEGASMIGTTAARCAESLVHAQQGISRARLLVDEDAGDELIALELRDVLEHLGRIVGQVYTDDILDRIFSRFCIGK